MKRECMVKEYGAIEGSQVIGAHSATQKLRLTYVNPNEVNNPLPFYQFNNEMNDNALSLSFLNFSIIIYI